MNNFKSIFCSFIATLDNYKIRYCVLRGYENLPDTFSNDIDFGIHPKDKKHFVLAVNSFVNSQKGKVLLKDSRFEVLKTTFQIQNLNLDFDFWYDFNYVGLRYMDIKQMLENPLKHNNIKVLSVEDELTLSFLKELLHNKKIRSDKIDILTDRLSKSDSTKIATFFNSSLKDQFLTAILNRNFELKQLSLKTKKYLVKYNIFEIGIFTSFINVSKFIFYRFFPSLNPLTQNSLFK